MTTPTRLIQEAADQELLWKLPRTLKQEYEMVLETQDAASRRWPRLPDRGIGSPRS